MKIKKLKLVANALILVAVGMVSGVANAAEFQTFLLPTPENNDFVYRSQDVAGCDPQTLTGEAIEGLCLFVPDGGGPGVDIFIPIAIQYDEFYSYSAALLDFLQQETPLLDPLVYGDLAPPGAGQGSQDVVVYTNSSGTSNDPVGPNPIQNDAACLADPGCFIFEDPANTTVGSGDYSYGYWGQGDQENDGITDTGTAGPVTVKDMEDYLKAYDPNNTTPVLLADYAQTGGDSWLLANGAILITDPSKAWDAAGCIDIWGTADPVNGAVGDEDKGDCITEVIALDKTLDGDFDTNDYDDLTLNFKEVTVLGTTFSILGSGQYDFYLLPLQTDSVMCTGGGVLAAAGISQCYFEPFDIGDYDDSFNFVVYSQYGCYGDEGGGNEEPNPDPEEAESNPLVGCQNNGPERTFLTGRLSDEPNFVPVPSTLALFGVGTLGLAFFMRRRASIA